MPGLMVLFVPFANAQNVLPQGGRVSSGQATIGTPTNGALTINQNSSRAVVDWNSFSVGAGNSVTFVQPSSSAAILNRVTGTTSSTIAGQINANGQVFLVNPNGIAITPTGTVQTGAFVGSTLGIANNDFNNGNYSFSGNGASAGVSNAGSIAVAPGGYVGLIGGTVSNDGMINAYRGQVGLGSGEQIILNPGGDGFLQVAVPSSAVPENGRGMVDVRGRVTAAGGQIQINAASAQNAARDVINVSGRLSAASVSGTRGNISLNGDNGTVSVTGSIDANGGTGQRGGSIVVTGGNVNLKGARISASGGTGGGSVQIGGGVRGTGPVKRATTTNVDTGTTISADATDIGDGGNIVIWSDYLTTFGGFISAKGGALGGNGGLAEVSGKIHLNLNGDYTKLPLANLTAARGNAGSLLFDPGTVSIVDQTKLANNTALNGPDTFTAQFISSQLATANVTISTTNATGANGTAGDINLLSNTSIAWSANTTLTLSAARNINFGSGATITGSGASSALALKAGADGTGVGTVNFTGGTQVNLASGAVDLYYNPVSNRTVTNGGTNNSAGTINATSYATAAPAAETWSSFITAGTTRAWMLVNNVFDLQNIQNKLSGFFALGGDVNASATSGWNSGAGFVPLGTDGAGALLNSSQGFTGKFDGQNYTISNLSITRGSSDRVGLFGYATGATIENLYMTGAVVMGGSGGTAGSGSGTLVGVADGSTIKNVSVSGTMVGSAGAGANSNIGGIVGELYRSSSLIDSSANVSVASALGSTGGAVGANEATSTVQNVFSTGTVNAASANSVGGLVGYNDGSITDSYASGIVAGTLRVGGLVGNNSGGSITYAYATGRVVGDTNVGGLVGRNAGTITQAYSTGQVTGSTSVGGFVGNNTGTINLAYFDTNTSGQGTGVGSGSGFVPGITTAQAMTQSTYAGVDFTSHWWMLDGQTRPFLRSEYTTTITNAHQLQLMNMSSTTLNANYTLRGSIDMTETSTGTGMWGASGFVPIGNDATGAVTNSGLGFRGAFDGAGGTISNLFINRPSTANVGLFAYTDTTGSISSLALASVDITGRGASPCCNSGVGALVGWNNGTITKSSSSGSVTSTAGGAYNIGGLVGQNTGSISESNSSANVSSSAVATGGLVGWNTGSGVITKSYATGSVSSSSNFIGGLVGTNNATISDSYATGSVSGGSSVGGLVGWNTSSGTIATSYSTGAVSGTQFGGFIGLSDGTVTSSYFDKQSAGTVNEVGSGSSTGINGLTTANLQNGSLPSGFSATTWLATNGQYPTLQPSTLQTITITATPSSNSMTYGNGTPSLSYTVTDQFGTVLCTSNCSAYFSGSAQVDTTATSTASVGSNIVYAAKGTISAVSGYVMKFVNSVVNITQRALTVTAGNQTKSYGTNLNLGTSGFTTSGLVNGDTVSSVTLTSSGAASGAGVNGSPYSLVPSNAIGTGLSNYSISYTNGQLTVTPVSITVTANSGSSTYGSSPANPGLSATGLVNGETASVLTGLSNSFGITSSTAVGTYALNVAGTLTNQNYVVTGTTSGSWIVNQAALIVTALGGSSSYGSSPSNPGLSAVGLKNGDTVAALTGLSNSFGITNLTDAGSYATNVVGTLTNPNYTLSGTNSGVWNVTPAPITVTALGGTSTYGTSPSNPGFTATGLQNGQTIAQLTGLSNSFGIDALTNAGGYTMSVIGTLTNGNYSITTRNTGTWTVNPAPITVAAIGGNSIYGSNPANPGFTATGLQNGQTESVLTGIANSFGIVGTTSAGTHPLSVSGTLTNGNYTITSRTGANWVVDPAPITVTANSGSSTYGSSPANPGLSATGLQNGETSSVLTGLSNSFGINNNTNAGSYALSVLGSLTNGNYYVTSTTGGSWTVNPASITVTALGGSSIYGSSPANPGLSATGLKNGQTVAVLTGLSNSFNITNLTNAGSYQTDVVGTLTNGNYTITTLNSGVWNVNPASITVTALGGSSTYGSSPSNPGLTATGLKNGETTSVLTGLSNSFGIDPLTNAGNYTMSVLGTLTNGNYTITSRSTNIWTVNPAPITVSALGGQSTYGTSPSNPGLSATGLQNGQDASVLTGLSNSFGITSSTSPGNYAMNVLGSLTNPNYTITALRSGTWSVFPVGVPLPPSGTPYVDTTGSIGKPGGGTDLTPPVVPTVALEPSAPLLQRLGGGTPGAGNNASANAVLAATTRAPIAVEEEKVVAPMGEPQLRGSGLSAMASAKPAGNGDGDEDCTTGAGGGDGGGSGTGSGKGGGRNGCKAPAPGAIKFALNEQTKNSVVTSIESALTEMISAKSAKYSVARNVTAGTTLLVTAGIIGWLLRGGALLSAMLSSVPLWREFDPLVVVQRPRRRDDTAEVTRVEKLFESKAAAPPSEPDASDFSETAGGPAPAVA